VGAVAVAVALVVLVAVLNSVTVQVVQDYALKSAAQD
jgi:hypothetical protein